MNKKNTEQRIAIVIPCFNEEGRIRRHALSAYLDQSENVKLFFVNDGSTDKTEKILTSIVLAYPKQAALINLESNKGKGEAVRAGFKEAFREHHRFVGFWDADLSTPLESIDLLIDFIQKDTNLLMVMGARIKMLGTNIMRNPFRHYLGRIFATFASIVLNANVYDTQCGAKLFRNRRIVRKIFERPFRSRWIFDVEIIARMIKEFGPNDSLTSLVCEVPLPVWLDTGRSKLQPADFIRSVLELLLIFQSLRKIDE